MSRKPISQVRIGLDPGSKEPLYRQLSKALIEAIQQGQFDTTELLPSSRSLATDLGLSRNTVNLALQYLMSDGYITSVARVGHMVNPEFQAHLDDTPRPRVEHLDWESRFSTPRSDEGHVWKPAGWSSYPYPFIAGQIETAMFPTKSWGRAMRSALTEEHAGTSLHDLVDRDDALLIEMLRRHILRARGITAQPEEILITLGSQHGLGLVATALLNGQSTVAIEEPGYPDARHMFRSRGATIHALPVDEQGAVIPSDLSMVDLVFVTPSHQYPTNATLSIGRRHALLNQASRDDFVIVEDDYDSEFRYLGQSTPAMKSIENSGRVIYLGSFSKFLAPGLRLGFVVAEPTLIEHLRDLRRYQLRHPPGILQRALALFIQSGDYNRSVRRIRNVYKEKWIAMSAAVEEHIPWPVPIPTGGLSIWVSGPSDFDATTMAELAIDEGVVVEAGGPCFVTPPIPRNHFKLGYASTPLGAIEPGLAIIARVIDRLR